MPDAAFIYITPLSRADAFAAFAFDAIDMLMFILSLAEV